MDRKSFPPSPVLLLILQLFSLPNLASAASIELVSYDFDTSAGDFENLPESIDHDLLATGWTDLTGSLTDFAGNPGRAIAARDWASGNALELEVQPSTGTLVTLSSLSFDERASSSGATQWIVAINDTLLATGSTTINDFGSHTINLAGLALSEVFNISLMGSGASSDSGTWRVDNFSLNGEISAVPLPAAGLLMLFALPLLAHRRQV